MVDSKKIEEIIILELKKESPLWINELHRRVISNNVYCSIPTVSKIVEKLKEEGKVIVENIGTAKTVRLKNETGKS
ncbi:MAG: hypothetical protein ACTSXD_12380 [Candidatus Heimdallarchaeaceae archaeon]